VCCGTKRMVEITCPADCGYLAVSRTHPPAVVQRQHDVDRGLILPLLQGLSERQARLFLMLAAVTARHQGELFQKLLDEDVSQAAAALAGTLETAGRGIVYEHRPTSVPASRLMIELKAMLDEMAKTAGSALDRDAAIALRRLEHGAKMTAAVRPGTNDFQQLLVRVLAPPQGAETPAQNVAAADQGPSLILP
jgi:hypothetical protein